ncbi:MAG: type IV secretion system DNA-binding domain-containing protein [Betaproteobacteria bacterium]|nr:type IV secretion system DNA-binding domain-containing protein [Betaproteobacteria bacterium]
MNMRDQYQRPPWAWAEGVVLGGLAGSIVYAAGWLAMMTMVGSTSKAALIDAWHWLSAHSAFVNFLVQNFQTFHSRGISAAWQYIFVYMGGWLISLIAVAIMILVAYFSARPNDPTGVRHLRGPRLIEGAPKIKGDGIEFLPGWRYTMRDERAHGIFLGSSGSGKTTLLRKIIRAALARGDKILISDSKGDFVSELEKVIIFAPWDKRSHRWAIGKDLDDELLLVEWATNTIPVPKSGDPVWAQAAQSILIAALSQIRAERGSDWFLSDLRQMLLQLLRDGQRVQKSVREYLPEAAGIVQDTRGKTFASIMMNLSAAMRALLLLCKLDARLAAARAPALSLRAWAHAKSAAPLVLLHHQQAAAMTKSWCSGTLDYLVSHFAGQPDCPPERNRTWFILDEAPQLGRVDSLIRGLEILRSKGVRIWLGVQSPAQFVHIYSDDLWRIVADNTSWKFVTRIQGDESANWAERMAGQRIVERYSRTRTGRESTETWTRGAPEPVMPAAEFRTRLEPDRAGVYALALIPGSRNIYRFHAPYDTIPKFREPRVLWGTDLRVDLREFDAQRRQLAEQASSPMPDGESTAPGQAQVAAGGSAGGSAGGFDADLTAWLQAQAQTAGDAPATLAAPAAQPEADGTEAAADSADEQVGEAVVGQAAEHLADAILPGAGAVVQALDLAAKIVEVSDAGAVGTAAPAAPMPTAAPAAPPADPFKALARRYGSAKLRHESDDESDEDEKD